MCAVLEATYLNHPATYRLCDSVAIGTIGVYHCAICNKNEVVRMRLYVIVTQIKYTCHYIRMA